MRKISLPGFLAIVLVLILVALSMIPYVLQQNSLTTNIRLSVLEQQHKNDANANTNNYMMMEDRLEKLERLLLDEKQKAEQKDIEKRLMEERVANLEEMLLKEEQRKINKTNNNTTEITAVSSLPSCKDLMNAPYSPYRDGEFLTRSTIPISWHPRVDDSRELRHSMCELHRYSANEARQCLAGKHLYMPGDSISRYLYLSLATFLHHRRYPPRFESPRNTKTTKSTTATTTIPNCTHFNEQGLSQCSSPNKPNVCVTTDWRTNDATEGMNTYTRAIATYLFDGHMEGKTFLKLAGRVENYLYQSSSNPDTRIQLSFTTEIGFTNGRKYAGAQKARTTNNNVESSNNKTNNTKTTKPPDKPDPLRGYYFTGCAAKGTCNLSTTLQEELMHRASNYSYDFEQPFVDAIGPTNGTLSKVLPPVDIIIYNRGLWGALTDEAIVKNITQNMYSFSGKEQGRCFFRSTTGMFDHTMKTEQTLVKPLTYQAGCGYIDFAHLLQDFEGMEYHPFSPPSQTGGRVVVDERMSIYTDLVHFQPWVYEELNNLLFNILCNTKQQQ